MEASRTHQIEIQPNNKQVTLINQHCGYARVARNYALSTFKEGLDNNEWLSAYDIRKQFNAEKDKLYPWCRSLSQNASKNGIGNFEDAVKRWKSGQNRFPVYKKRSDSQSYQADNGRETVKVSGRRISLPRIGWIRLREGLRWSGEICKVIVSHKDGRYFVSITVSVDSDDSEPNLPVIKKPIGIDVGINTLATCLDGVYYENPRPLLRYERKLRRTGRTLSRRKFRSQNWYKAKSKLTRIHARIQNIRKDAHHKASTEIVRRASKIGIETLNVRGMLKNRKLAKALSDSALSQFLIFLKYKADRRGIPVTAANQFFASSKTCSHCGHKKENLLLSDRIYDCSECRLEIDRDLNAAINLCPSQ